MTTEAEGRAAPDGTPLSSEQSAVLDLIESTRENVFVTGRAGTGKSTLLESFIAGTDRQAQCRYRSTQEAADEAAVASRTQAARPPRLRIFRMRLRSDLLMLA